MELINFDAMLPCELYEWICDQKENSSAHLNQILYAALIWSARTYRMEGKVQTALELEIIADQTYQNLPEELQW